MRTLFRLMPMILVLAAILSCGGEQQESAIIEAHSMDEALALAAQHNSVIAIEFWIDG